jgi:Ser/Thr protein kinase RdoA (MazF antagonist)
VTVSSTAIDAVLQTQPPAFTPEQACEIGRGTFGIEASGATNLGSERDQAFMLTGSSGSRVAVLKVSNPAEDPAMLDMEATAALHAARCDPGLTIAVPRRRPTGQVPRPAELADFRARWNHHGAGHWVRAYDVLPGRIRLDPLTLQDPALTAWGETTARLGLALRGFIHPSAIRRLPWDVQHAARVRPMTASIADRDARAAVDAVLDRYDEAVAPRWGLLRAQVVHSDLTADNVLADDDGMITGIVDFGDLTHTALMADLAAVLDSLCGGRNQADMFRVARLVIDGYERMLPLEPLELELLGELWAARAAVTVAIGSWRSGSGLEDPAFAERFSASALAMIEHLLSAGWAGVARQLGARTSANVAERDVTGGQESIQALADRRDAVFGPAMEPLSYAEPIEMATASGVWMIGTDGRRYLDMYNNVVCVGHAHPRVTGAVSRQWRRLNTNLRYLHASAVELAERLVASCPKDLDTVLFVNSGSEANDLAWRLACWHTGNAGGLCTEFAYHGITAAMADFSPEVAPGARAPDRVQTWAPPDSYRGLHQDASGFEAALGRLASHGFAPAAAIFDSVLQSDGIYDLQASYVRELVRLTHEAGGSGSPTRSRAGMAALASRCGRSSDSASFPTSSHSASRWATGSR